MTDTEIDKTIRVGKAIIVYDPWGYGWSRAWEPAKAGWAIPGGRWTDDISEALRCAQVLDKLLAKAKKPVTK